MKKIFGLLMIAGMMSFVACGPSAAELAEKAKADSIRVADSLSAIAAAEQAKADSIAAAEAAAAADTTKPAEEVK
jgi:hypothetical protein